MEPAILVNCPLVFLSPSWRISWYCPQVRRYSLQIAIRLSYFFSRLIGNYMSPVVDMVLLNNRRSCHWVPIFGMLSSVSLYSNMRSRGRDGDLAVRRQILLLYAYTADVITGLKRDVCLVRDVIVSSLQRSSNRPILQGNYRNLPIHRRRCSCSCQIRMNTALHLMLISFTFRITGFLDFFRRPVF
jgi:hypothetical protein